MKSTKWTVKKINEMIILENDGLLVDLAGWLASHGERGVVVVEMTGEKWTTTNRWLWRRWQKKKVTPFSAMNSFSICLIAIKRRRLMTIARARLYAKWCEACRGKGHQEGNCITEKNGLDTVQNSWFRLLWGWDPVAGNRTGWMPTEEESSAS